MRHPPLLHVVARRIVEERSDEDVWGLLAPWVVLGSLGSTSNAPTIETTERHRHVHALFDLQDLTVGPFPADRFTVADGTQLTGIRVNLPLPDCSVMVSDCDDLNLINLQDGFNLQPRLTISFDGAISVSTVTNDNITLIDLSSGWLPRKIGINQIVWDPDQNTLYVQSDEVLNQHSHFGLIVTNGVLDTNNNPVISTAGFSDFITYGTGDYHARLMNVVSAAVYLGINEGDIVTASEFTTQSATAIMEKIRAQIQSSVPAPASFINDSGIRTVFARGDVASITWNEQTTVTPPGFTSSPLNMASWDWFGPYVGTLAFGRFTTTNYQTADGYIPDVGTLTGTPTGQPLTLSFNLVLPVGPKPANGWPVAIVSHGGNNSKEAVIQVASKMAQHGIATIAINAVGHGFGPLGTLVVALTSGQHVTVPSPGRGIDQNGDNVIGSQEGFELTGNFVVLRTRETLRQTAADLLQVVREIQVGMDVDGDGVADLDSSNITYFGVSLGGAYGAVFLGMATDVSVGDITDFFGIRTEQARTSIARRGNEGTRLQDRIPSLLNSPGITQLAGVPVPPPYFNENLPFRDQPPVINNVPGAIPIQRVFDYAAWVMMSGNPTAYTPYIRLNPLPGDPSRAVLVQWARGDQNVPNWDGTRGIRAGGLADVTSYYLHDVAYADNPSLPKNPHAFLFGLTNPAIGPIASQLQEQIATFLDSGGTNIIHPTATQYWQVPTTPPLPEDLFFIP